MRKVFLVHGYMNTGSGSLTYPEDFDFVAVYQNMEDAQADCDRRNKKTLDEMKVNVEKGESVKDTIDDLDCDDFMKYDVSTLELK